MYLYRMQVSAFFRSGLLVLVFFAAPGCVDDKPPQNRFEKISTAYCECTARLVTLNQEAEAAGEAHLNEYFQKMQTEYSRAKECAATIIGQFGHLNAAELDSVNLLVQVKCPDLADKPELLQELLGE